MSDHPSDIQKDPIAIIGLGCRFPGGSVNPSRFWDLMAGGEDGIVPVPSDRWHTEKYFDADEQMPSRMYISAGGFLQNRIDQFDAAFFGLSPREAALLDPQQRLLLEVAWEAMEDAGLVVERLAGSDTAVYVGGLALDNMITQLHPDNLHTVGVHTAVSTMMTMLSNRISYTFDLRGPSMSIDTACSSSLVAVHQACQAIWAGECNLALVGGVNVMHRPEYLVTLCKGGFLARDGRCKSFDERADGYGRGEGAGIAVLKPYSQALRDGDSIYAVIRGTGVNQDGRTDGITVPNPESQEVLVRRVMQEAGVTARELAYIEAHGTGTAVGDPLEASALAAAVGRQREGQAIPIGSVKANIGHLEAAAGIASLIKAALVLSKRQVPPVANLGQPNPKIPFEESNLRLPRSLEPLAGEAGATCIGINSFGYGGTNAHAVLQDAPVPTPAGEPAVDAADADRPHVLPISARSAGALKELAAAYLHTLDDVGVAGWIDVCRSAALRRDHHDHRLAVVSDSPDGLRKQLQDFIEKGELLGGFSGTSAHKQRKPVFVFTGMGPQWWAMGRELYRSEPVFRAAVHECDEAFKRISDWHILDELMASEEASNIAVPHVSACTNFMLQVGLVTLLRSWGIEPSAVVGHSLGEIGAAWGCGALDLASAIDVLYHRSRLLNRISGQGTMASVGMSAEAVAPYLAAEGGRVSIAAVNSPQSITLTGDKESLQRIAAKLEQVKVSPIFMQVQMAYHSVYMEPLKEDMYAALKDVRVQTPHCDVYSSVTGGRVQASDMDIDYWWRNMRDPVYFAPAIDALIADGHRLFLEIGPQPVLSSSVKQCLAHRGASGTLVASLRRSRPERASLAEMLAILYAAGSPIDWRGVHPQGGRYVKLPSYPWQRETHWHETEQGRVNRLSAPAHPLLGERCNAVKPVWESRLNNGLMPCLADHHVQGLRVLAGASYAEQGLALHAALGGAGASVIENMQFHQALVIEPRDEPVVQTSYDPDRRQYEVHSRKRTGDEWRLHARGELSFLQPAVPADIDVAPIQARCTIAMSGEEHYRDMGQRGLQYGPYFQGVQKISRDPSGDEVLAWVENTLALQDRPQVHRFHPALLDAALQTLLTTLGAKGDNEVYIPVRIGRLVLHRPPVGGFWCNGVLLKRWEGGAQGNVTLFDAAGRVFAEVRDIVAQALTRKEQAAGKDVDQWLYEFQWQAAAAVQPRTGGRWIVLEDRQGVGMRLARELRQAGASHVQQLPASMDFDRRLELIAAEAQAEAGLQGVVYLGGLDANSDDFGTPAGVQMIRLIQSLSTLSGASHQPELVVVTRDAQRVHDDEIQANVSQATLIGGARVANNEYPDFVIKAVDIDGQPASIAALAREVLCADAEDEVALRGSERHVHRLRRRSSQDLQAASGRAWQEEGTAAAAAPRAGEVQVALRRIRLRANLPHIALGEVTQTGADVTRLSAGQLALLPVDDAQRATVTLPADALLAVDPTWASGAEALDVADWAEAVLALQGHVRPAAWVLVTAAASSLGRAVVQVASQQGARVIALVQGMAQAEALRDLEVQLIDVAHEGLHAGVQRVTEGHGIDIVVDLQGGEIAQKAVASLAVLGQYIGLGVTPAVPAECLKDGRSLRRSDFSLVLRHQPERARDTWGAAVDRVKASPLKPASRRSMPQPKSHEVADSVPTAPEVGSMDLEVEARASGDALFQADASYLITGGFGGFGLSSAAWMVEQGARNLVLVGRRGANTPEAQQAVQALEKAGARVLCVAADVSREEDVMRMIEDVRREMPVLRGIFHTAAVLQDSPINQILPEHVHAVMNPKAGGAWYLHQHTQDLPIDYFILFSSVAGLVGGPGQASYAMSCEYQDALARHRRALGLAATSINWGALAEVGMVARHGEVAKYFSVTGVGSFSPAQAVDMLGKALSWSPVHIGMAIMDWQAWGATYPAWAASPKYMELADEKQAGSASGSENALVQSLKALGEDERRQRVEDILAGHLAQVAQMPLERVDRQVSLLNLGLDSLMAMELQMAVENSVGVKVSTLELMKGNNLVQLAQVVSVAIMEKGEQADQGGAVTPAGASSPAAAASVSDQIDALKDEDIDKLLSQLLEEQVQA